MAKYFVDKELACKGRCCAGTVNVGDGINPRLYEVLDAIRERVGSPVHVTSGYRCPTHNAYVGGVPNSQHTLGIACDIYSDNVGVYELATIAIECGADGVGVYPSQGFVHIDVRGYNARWEG